MTETDERLALLLDQLDAAWEMLEARLTGRHPWTDDPKSGITTMTDDEYLWEPVPDCWSVRPRGEARGPNPVGKGDWLLEGGYPEPQPPPFTTIAWRMCHICVSPLMRHDYTFGTHSLTLNDVTWPVTAQGAFEFVREIHFRWRSALAGVSSRDLDTIGFSQNPDGLDRGVRFVDLVVWTNLEFAHHAAEIACLRDLYRAQKGQR